MISAEAIGRSIDLPKQAWPARFTQPRPLARGFSGQTRFLSIHRKQRGTLLFDVNGLIALVHVAHPDHGKARLCLAALPTAATLHTCAITEIGFVRVSLAAKLCVSVAEAKGMLSALLAQSRVARLTDDLGADSLPAYVKKPADVTDGHLLALAKRHGAKLDTGIPGAELIT